VLNTAVPRRSANASPPGRQRRSRTDFPPKFRRPFSSILW
jgi:hypothetical protein